MSYNSKYSGQQVENLLDQVANGNAGGGGGGITTEIDPIFSASPAAKITDDNIASWSNKVDKVDGKQLSTEDFTTLLKQKLDGLSNYDDTEIQTAVSKLRTDLDTLVSGDTTTAIKTFNEVIAFLDGISDTEDLASIITSIEQQIATKGTYTKPSSGIPKSDLASDVQTSLGKADTALQSYTEKYTGTYSKPSGGIPKSDLASAVQTSLGKADTALQSYTEQYKGTVTGVKMNGTTKNPSSGVVDLGTVITSHQDISGKQDKLVSGSNIKTINGTSILGSGDISISGGGGVYITPFTVDQFCLDRFILLTDEQRNELLNAASQNRIIGMPYRTSGSIGYIVADFKYETFEDDPDFWDLTLGVIYNGAYYSSSIRSNTNNNFMPTRYNITTFKPFEYFVIVEDGVATVNDGVSYIDNCVFYVEGDCSELRVLFEPSPMGKTVRFFTGESCALEFIAPVYWANGVVPTIEPYTHYELSIVSNQEYGYNAVLTPFKLVES